MGVSGIQHGPDGTRLLHLPREAGCDWSKLREHLFTPWWVAHANLYERWASGSKVICSDQGLESCWKEVRSWLWSCCGHQQRIHWTAVTLQATQLSIVLAPFLVTVTKYLEKQLKKGKGSIHSTMAEEARQPVQLLSLAIEGFCLIYGRTRKERRECLLSVGFLLSSLLFRLGQ